MKDDETRELMDPDLTPEQEEIILRLHRGETVPVITLKLRDPSTGVVLYKGGDRFRIQPIKSFGLWWYGILKPEKKRARKHMRLSRIALRQWASNLMPDPSGVTSEKAEATHVS